ncbi:MAG: undecaprenyldiphospho-muramoylpentapeptide beta-N-acetylglucosaminyltransferase [Bacteroidota bacterium]
MKANPRYILSGGGTGGHIFPAIAIADKLRAQNPDAAILFVGAKGRMEMEKVPAAGYPIEGLWISGLQRSLSLSNLMFPFKVVNSLYQSSKIINAFKPDVVLGTGGYASGPLLRMAAMKGIPTLIHEANSYPGITNRLLGKKVDKILVAFEGMQKYFPGKELIMTGNPVRKDIMNLEGKKQEAADFFKLNTRNKTLFVVGGSLGARTLNESIMGGLDTLAKQNIQLIWQTGKSFHTNAEEAVISQAYNSARVFPFISRMDLAYSLTDVVISRAGAISISELCLCGKAAILVPSPNVTEDHQTKNASALASQQAAILIPDSSAREILVEKAITLLADETMKNTLSKNIKTLGIPDSVDRIIKEINSLIQP